MGFSDFLLFGPRKEHLAGKWVAADAEVEQAVNSKFKTLTSISCRSGYSSWRDGEKKCFISMATTWKSDVCHLLRKHHVKVKIEFLSLSCLLHCYFPLISHFIFVCVLRKAMKNLIAPCSIPETQSGKSWVTARESVAIFAFNPSKQSYGCYGNTAFLAVTFSSPYIYVFTSLITYNRVIIAVHTAYCKKPKTSIIVGEWYNFSFFDTSCTVPCISYNSWCV